MITRALTFMLCLFLYLPAVAVAGPDSYSYGGSKSKGLNNATTNRLVRTLERGLRLCQSLDAVYRYDCYRQNYKSAADRLQGNAAYAVPLAALRDIEQTLQTVVARNGDPAAAPKRKGGGTFRAVTPASTAKAKETFRRSLDAATTVLLRSKAGSGNHFARIAQVLDSDKVLLRADIPADHHVG